MVHSVIATCVGVILMFTGSSLAYTDTSSGSGSGVTCGGHVCAEYASCSINDTCICNDAIHNSGNGYLKCYSQTFMGAFLLNDPILSTYDNEHANLAIPCRYEFTQVTSNFLDNNGFPAGTCGVHVRGFNRKHRGKFYVHGVDVAFRVTFNNGTTFKMSVRKFGVAEDGTYFYQINATEGIYDVDGPFNDDDVVYYDWVTGMKVVECTIDKLNNVAVINITHCGVCIYFRPYDVILRRNQTQIPGIGVGLDTFHSPFFVNAYLPVALIPSYLFNSVTFADLPLQVSNTADIIHRAFSKTIPQNNPYSNDYCNDVTLTTNTIPDVTEVRIAYLTCTWMLLSPKFIRCYDDTDTGEKITRLFSICLQIQTLGNSKCDMAQSLISGSGCQAHDPTNDNLNSFLSSPICKIT